MAPKTTIALIYDFDKTLCTRDMQEYGFISNIGVKAKDFWESSSKLTATASCEKSPVLSSR